MDVEKYILAGKIWKEVMDFAYDYAKEGVSLLDLAKKIEEKIIKLGGKCAFPPNLSLNEIAAHDTPEYGDKRVLKKGDLLKIDIGVHVDGYIADGARTKEIGTKNWKDLIEASKKAVESVVKNIGPETTFSEIGSEIQEIIESYGFSPIRNLSGHQLERYKLHAGKNVPNYKSNNNQEIGKGAFAIEPFATNGVGFVLESGIKRIFRLENKKPIRNVIGRKILNFIDKEYRGLPFAERWIYEKFGEKRVIFRELANCCLHGYGLLKEKGNGMVSQWEHTIIVGDKTIITTL